MLKAVTVAAYSLPLEGCLPGCPSGVREGFLLKLEDTNSYFAFGECAPLDGFSCESLDIARQQLLDCAKWLASTPESLELVHQQGLVSAAGQYSSSVVFAVESAVSQLHQLEYGGGQPLPVCIFLSGDQKNIIQQIDNLELQTRRVKLKVARQSVAQDIALFQAIDTRLPASIKVRLDANRGWSWSDAMTFSQSVNLDRIAFIEEPLVKAGSEPGLLQEFAQKSGMGIALDESLQGNSLIPEPFDGLAALVVKPTLAGGVYRCRQLCHVAKQHRLEFVISSSYESNIGIDFLARLARQLAPDTAPGLDTLSVFRQWLLQPPVSQFSGNFPVVSEMSLKKLWLSHD